MNSYDKTSLYEMSYAFMRRFAFIHIGAPDIPEERSKRENLVRKYAETWEYSLDAKTVQGLADIWYATNAGMDRRKSAQRY
jgi:MoxR-like ATPase